MQFFIIRYYMHSMTMFMDSHIPIIVYSFIYYFTFIFPRYHIHLIHIVFTKNTAPKRETFIILTRIDLILSNAHRNKASLCRDAGCALWEQVPRHAFVCKHPAHVWVLAPALLSITHNPNYLKRNLD